MIHIIERVAEDDRYAYYCTCGRFLSRDAFRAASRLDDHLEHEVTRDPLDELAILEAKQRHPSRREWVSDDQVLDQ
jgi:hypothetical protein